MKNTYLLLKNDINFMQVLATNNKEINVKHVETRRYSSEPIFSLRGDNSVCIIDYVIRKQSLSYA